MILPFHQKPPDVAAQASASVREELASPASVPSPWDPSIRSVLIRPFQATDALPMYEAVRETREQLCAWMNWCHPAYSITDAKAFISLSQQTCRKEADRNFAIIDKEHGDFLGSVALNQVNWRHKFANIGYWVRTSAVGRGVATRAVKLVAHQALHELGFNRLEFLIPVGNLGSRLVAQKAGAQFEGILRKRIKLAPKIYDAAMYSMVVPDLPPGLTDPNPGSH